MLKNKNQNKKNSFKHVRSRKRKKNPDTQLGAKKMLHDTLPSSLSSTKETLLVAVASALHSRNTRLAVASVLEARQTRMQTRQTRMQTKSRQRRRGT
jgi:hypothetical protein